MRKLDYNSCEALYISGLKSFDKNLKDIGKPIDFSIGYETKEKNFVQRFPEHACMNV